MRDLLELGPDRLVDLILRGRLDPGRGERDVFNAGKTTFPRGGSRGHRFDASASPG